MKHTFKVCNKLWVERNTSKFQNGFVENLSNIALQTTLSSQTRSMTIAEGGVFLDCCVSPNQEVFQGWNSKTCGTVGQMDFPRADWGLLNTGLTPDAH